MEQPHVPAAAPVVIVSGTRTLSHETRASLEAVREAQEAARLRARRQTAKTRVFFATLVGGVALTVVSVGPRVGRWRQARAQAATPVRPSLIAPPPVVAAAVAPAVVKVSAAEVPKVAAQAHAQAAGDAAGPDAECDTALIRTAPWRLSPQACVRAFAADPTNATLALAIAHAEHGDGHLAAAAHWAKQALALDPKAAEAYVMIARADEKDGRHDDARTAYRHYLDLAPRGWHKAEARAALRRARATAQVD